MTRFFHFFSFLSLFSFVTFFYDFSCSPLDFSLIQSNIKFSVHVDNQPSEFHCDFEDGLCEGWAHNTDGQFLWTVINGSTPSPHTGPAHDHTKQTPQGKYLLMEASSQGFLYRAMMQSPQFNISLHEDYRVVFLKC